MIKFEDVSKAYTGKVGCACGCNGNYYVASHFGVENGNKDCGYEAYTECNDRAVKMAVNKLNSLIDWSNPNEVKKHVNDEWAYVDHGIDRTITLYFMKPMLESIQRRAMMKAIQAAEVAAA